MNGDLPPIDPRKGERERHSSGVIVAAVECKRHSPGSEVNNLTVAAVVIDDGSEIAARRCIQTPSQNVATPRLVIGFRSEARMRQMLPLSGVGDESGDQTVFSE